MDAVASKSQTGSSNKSAGQSETGDKTQTSKGAAQFSEASSRSTPMTGTAAVMQNTVSAVKGSDDNKKSSASDKSDEMSHAPEFESIEVDDKPSQSKPTDNDSASFSFGNDTANEKPGFLDSWFSDNSVISLGGKGFFAVADTAAKQNQGIATEVEQKINSSLLKAAKISGADINHLIEGNSGIFTTNADGEIVLKPVIVKDTVRVDDDALLDKEILDRMQARIQLNDRANAYLELYNATGEEQLVLQTQITTYTGAIGSMALVGNMLAKDANPEKYNLSLDQFSLDILQGTHDLARQFVDEPVYNLDRNRLQDADHAVWASKGMGEHFPGNVQFRDYKRHENPKLVEQIYNSQGTINSLQMGQEFNMPSSAIRNIGNRPAEFMGDKEKYTHVDGERFISVIETDTGHIVAFWDKNIQLPKRENPTSLPMIFNQIQNVSRTQTAQFDWHGNSGSAGRSTRDGVSSNTWDYRSASAIRNYLEADNRQIPINEVIETIDSFALSYPVESGVLDIIRDEIRDEDFVLWMWER